MEAINKALVLIFFFLIFLIIILAFVYWTMSLKQKNNGTKAKDNQEDKKNTTKVKQNYNVQSIFNFMEFERIEDNMIIQKDGKRFLMAIECQGVNYDLMSEIEKNAVESGFMQFLNTLREPIQIYIQSRTVNLDNSVKKYKIKIDDVERELRQKEISYRNILENPNATEKQINLQKMEYMRVKNLYEYGRDIVANTEKMSFNKNILRKKYYIILSYYHSGNDDGEFYDFSEVKDKAFSELYTKAQTIIRTIASTGVIGRIADSYGLVELLYNAYNKEESDTFGINKALLGGYDELYVTTEDVFAKRMKLLDEKIADEATALAERAVLRAKTRMQKKVEEKENSMEDLINDLAKQLIGENENYLGINLAKEAKNEVDLLQNNEKEEKENAKKGRKKTTRK